MKRFFLGVTASLFLLAAGCEHDCYEIEVRPDGAEFQRQLTAWHLGGKDDKEVQPLAADKIAQLAKLYAEQKTADGGKKQVFVGRFADGTPQDVGGAGHYLHLVSPAGSSSCYAERFRGNDDLEGQLAARRKAADQLTDLLIGWLEVELGKEPNFPQLKKFLDQDLRRDLKNLGLYEWTNNVKAAGSLETNGEGYVRAAMYLCERGYFTPADIPRLARALDDDEYEALLAFMRGLLARKLGVDAATPALGFMENPDKWLASFRAYVGKTELYKQHLAEWEAKREQNPALDNKRPQPEDFAGSLLIDVFAAMDSPQLLGFDGDWLKMTLFCPAKPYATNGQWDDKSGSASWSGDLSAGHALPMFCFAAWSEPNKEYQEKHFGKVMLADDALAEYVAWHCGLTPDEAREWEQFITGLKPGPEWEKAVRAFRFSTDPKPSDKPDVKTPSLADVPRGLLAPEKREGQQ
jgi:hypothetical protein